MLLNGKWKEQQMAQQTHGKDLGHLLDISLDSELHVSNGPAESNVLGVILDKEVDGVLEGSLNGGNLWDCYMGSNGIANEEPEGAIDGSPDGEEHSGTYSVFRYIIYS